MNLKDESMIRFLMVLLFMASQLFALEGMRVRIKQNEDSIFIKIIKPYTRYELKRYKNPNQGYITQIIAEANGKTIYNILTGLYMSNTYRFRFRPENFSDDDKIKITIIDSLGQKVQKAFSKKEIFDQIAVWDVTASEIERNSTY